MGCCIHEWGRIFLDDNDSPSRKSIAGFHRNAKNAGSKQYVRAMMRQYGLMVITGSLGLDSLASKDCLCSPVLTVGELEESTYPLQFAREMIMVIASCGSCKDYLRIST